MQPDTFIPKTIKIQVLKCSIKQAPAEAPTCKIFQDTIGITAWTRESEGIYHTDTELKYDLDKIYIPGQSDKMNTGAATLVLNDNTKTIVGSLLILPVNNAGKLRITLKSYDTSGTVNDLADAIGDTSIYLPTIEYHN